MIAAELMKVRTRWLPYVLLILVTAGATAQVLLFGLVAYLDERGSQDQFQSVPPGYLTFTFPWSLQALLDSGQFWGGVFIAFFVASVVATEYGWGTARAAVARGQTRSQYLWAKLLGTALASAAMLLFALAVGLGLSLLVTWLRGDPITLDVPGGPSSLEVPLMILRAALGILPYAMLAFCLTVVGRSTALGATVTLVYKIVESIVLPILTELDGVWIWANFRVLFIGHHADALIAANRIGFLEYNSIAFRNVPVASDTPDPWVAAFVLLAYTAGLAAIAFFVFQRRDLAGRNE